MTKSNKIKLMKTAAKVVAWTPAVAAMIKIAESMGYSLKEGRMSYPTFFAGAGITAVGTVGVGAISEAATTGLIDMILEKEEKN